MSNARDSNDTASKSSWQYVKSTIFEFSVNTATHGLPGIARSNNIPTRIFWIISTLAFTGIMVYFIVQSITTFLQYPTQVSISVTDGSSGSFPAISICNYSPFRYDLFVTDFLNYMSNLAENDTDNYTIAERQRIYIRRFINHKQNENEPVNSYFFRLEDILISCRFNNLPCDKNDFVTFQDGNFGNCFTFNAKPSVPNKTVYSLTHNGVWGILHLELYIHSHQYVPHWSPGVGMVVQIHDNQQIPRLFWRGHYLKPGQRQRILFTKQIQQRLSYPYSECRSDSPPIVQIVFDHFSNASYAYQQYICVIACIQAYVYSSCGCIDPSEWTARYLLVPGTNNTITAPLCDESDTCYRRALDRINNDYDLWMTFCPMCTVECTTVDFFTKMSTLLAPPEWLIDDLKTKIEILPVPLPTTWPTSWQSDISKNYIALEVVSESFRLQLLNDSASIQPVDLLSNIGGQTGLWIGISFLSLMEIVELFYRLIRSAFYKIREGLFRFS